MDPCNKVLLHHSQYLSAKTKWDYFLHVRNTGRFLIPGTFSVPSFKQRLDRHNKNYVEDLEIVLQHFFYVNKKQFSEEELEEHQIGETKRSVRRCCL